MISTGTDNYVNILRGKAGHIKNTWFGSCRQGASDISFDKTKATVQVGAMDDVRKHWFLP